MRRRWRLLGWGIQVTQMRLNRRPSRERKRYVKAYIPLTARGKALQYHSEILVPCPERTTSGPTSAAMSARIPAPVAVAQQPREIFTSLSIRHSSPLYFDRCCYLDQRQKHTGQTSADCGFIRNSFSASYHRYFTRTWYLLFTENQVVAMEREAFYEMSSAEFIKVCR